ncbi:MAG TPA: hypothetical protein V6C97_06315, partial [Oculatellaceae cyanobacterium]
LPALCHMQRWFFDSTADPADIQVPAAAACMHHEQLQLAMACNCKKSQVLIGAGDNIAIATVMMLRKID